MKALTVENASLRVKMENIKVSALKNVKRTKLILSIVLFDITPTGKHQKSVAVRRGVNEPAWALLSRA